MAILPIIGYLQHVSVCQDSLVMDTADMLERPCMYASRALERADNSHASKAAKAMASIGSVAALAFLDAEVVAEVFAPASS